MTVRLYVEPMDAVLVEADQSGRIRLEGEDWHEPTLQERRAIIYAASNEIAQLTELVEKLDTLGIVDTGNNVNSVSIVNIVDIVNKAPSDRT